MKVEIVNDATEFEIHYPVVVVGAGACGLTAALAVRDAGHEVLVLEQDKSPMGTTAMSTGLIPAAGTVEQKQSGIEDSPDLFVEDVQRKAQNGSDPAVVQILAEESAETISWLRDQHNIPLSLVSGFLYPGHSAKRMYGSPGRSGAELMAGLQSAVEQVGADILTEALVEDLIADSNKRVLGVRIVRPDGAVEEVGCDALVLACCGFAGNTKMIEQYIPEMSNATFHGHPGNKGHAIEWGKFLGAELADMGAYQGHGGLAAGYAIPILWPLIMEGGFQMNKLGVRFSDESKGYSEQAVKVLDQPDQIAWSSFDQRLYDLMMQFEDFKNAVAAGAILQAEDIASLAEKIKVPFEPLTITMETVEASAFGEIKDAFDRDFSQTPILTAPFYAARVTGALFHTQGGLSVDTQARVLDQQGSPLPNVYAGGGAARGISGTGASGYIAGNGLLTATGLGKIAGRNAAQNLS